MEEPRQGAEGSEGGGSGLLEARRLGSPLASSGTEFPDFPLSSPCLLLPPSGPRLPQIADQGHHPLLESCPGSPLSPTLARAGWDRVLTVSLGLRWEQVLDRQTRLQMWLRELCVETCLLSASPGRPPPHWLHPLTDKHPAGRGARSGQRRPLSPGLEQAALCPVLQPRPPPPPAGPQRAGPRREVGKGLRRTLRSPSLPYWYPLRPAGQGRCGVC